MVSQTSFLDAVKAGDQSAVLEALDANPSLMHEPSNGGIGPVALAAYHGHSELANTLVDRGAPVDIFVAAIVGRTEALRRMLESDRSLVRAWSPDGWTPLHLAAFFGHTEAVRLLLDAGADVAAVSRNDQANTPLHASLPGRHYEIIEALLATGADVNASQAHSFTPLHEAALIGDPAMARMLLERGSDWTVTTDQGQTALQLAEREGHEEVAEFLRCEPNR